MTNIDDFEWGRRERIGMIFWLLVLTGVIVAAVVS